MEDPIEMERLADEDARPRAHALHRLDDPEEIAARIRRYVDLGFDELVFHAPGDDQARFLDQFADDVLPLLRHRLRGMLKDRVMFMSGGSRGIGLAIATRVAQDGVKVALMAKTAEPHPQLPGTIYTAAEEIEAAGGEALPIVGDIRDDEAVDAAVAADGRALRRHRPGREQRQRHQPRPDARPRGEALRPDAADQRARHVRGHARMPAAPARVRPRARAHALAAAVGRPALAARPQRLHALEDGHDDDHARRGRRRGRGRRRRQLPVAAHDHRHGRGPEPARRRRGDGRAPACRRSWPTPPTRSWAATRASAPATSSSTTRCSPRRA